MRTSILLVLLVGCSLNEAAIPGLQDGSAETGQGSGDTQSFDSLLTDTAPDGGLDRLLTDVTPDLSGSTDVLLDTVKEVGPDLPGPEAAPEPKLDGPPADLPSEPPYMAADLPPELPPVDSKPSGTDNCIMLEKCLWSCTDSDAACHTACLDKARPSAVAAHNELVSCIGGQLCSAPLTQCGDSPSTCDPVGKAHDGYYIGSGCCNSSWLLVCGDIIGSDWPPSCRPPNQVSNPGTKCWSKWHACTKEAGVSDDKAGHCPWPASAPGGSGSSMCQHWTDCY